MCFGYIYIRLCVCAFFSGSIDEKNLGVFLRRNDYLTFAVFSFFFVSVICLSLSLSAMNFNLERFNSNSCADKVKTDYVLPGLILRWFADEKRFIRITDRIIFSDPFSLVLSYLLLQNSCLALCVTLSNRWAERWMSDHRPLVTCFVGKCTKPKNEWREQVRRRQKRNEREKNHHRSSWSVNSDEEKRTQVTIMKTSKSDLM